MTLPRWFAPLLTLLCLAPLASRLAAQTAVSVNLEGWSSVWVQRGASDVWDATWTSPNDQVRTVMEGAIRGRRIEMRRLSSSDGVLCEYRGAIGPDGRSASGTQVCPGAAAVSWVGQVQDRGPGGLPGRPEPFASAGPYSVNADGWTSTWTQRGRSGVWDAVWVQGRNRVSTVMEGGAQGDEISMRRVSSSDGVLCEYRGRIAPDRRSISGTQSCPGSRDVAWVGQVGEGGYVPPLPPLPPPVAPGTRYRVDNLAFQSERGGASSEREFLIDTRRCTVRELNQATDQGQQEVQVLICQPNRRLAFSTSVRGRVTMEYDWLFSDEGRNAVGVWRDGRGFGPSVAESQRR